MGEKDISPAISAVVGLRRIMLRWEIAWVLAGIALVGYETGSVYGAEPTGRLPVPLVRRLPPTRAHSEPSPNRQHGFAHQTPSLVPAGYQHPVGATGRVVRVQAEQVMVPPGTAGSSPPSGGDDTFPLPEHVEPSEIAMLPPDSSILYELQEAHYIHVGDQLEILFPFRPSFNQQLTVRDDGFIAPLLLPPLMAAGQTPEWIEAQLRSMYQAVRYDARANRQNARSRQYLLQVGDELEIRFAVASELNDRTIVRPDGRITLARVGQVLAEGQPVEELEESLIELYKQHVPRPDLVVIVRKSADNEVYVDGKARSVGFSGLDELSVRIVRQAPRLVYVTGEVGNPAAIPFLPGMTALRAIITAGGFKRTSAMHRVVIVRRISPEDSCEMTVNLQPPSFANKLWCKDGGYLDSPLRPDDVLVVPKTAVAKLQDVLDQYVYNLFPTTRNSQIVLFYDFRGGQNLNAGAVVP